MKKFLVIFLVFMTVLPVFAVQYLAQTGNRKFNVTPNVTYSAFLASLDANKYQTLSTDPKNYVTVFRAGGIDFTGTITADGKKDSIMQIVPLNPNKMVPVSIYRRIFTITEEIILKPDAKNRTFYFTN